MRERLIGSALLLVSLAGVLYTGLFASAPFWEATPGCLGYVVLHGVSPSLVALGTMAILLPLSSLPGLAGIAVLLVAVLRRAGERRQETEEDRQHEATLAAWLDHVTEQLLTDAPEQDAGSAAERLPLTEPPREVQRLDKRRLGRLQRFLHQLGLVDEPTGGLPPSTLLPPVALPTAYRLPVRVAAAALFAVGVFFAWWAWCSYLTVQYYAAAQPIAALLDLCPADALFGGIFLLIPAFLSFVAATGILWLFRRERRTALDRQHLWEVREEEALQGLLRRLEGLAARREREGAVPEDLLRRVGRAHVSAAISELSSARMERLGLALAQHGLYAGTADLDLSGVDPSRAVLAGAAS